MSKITNRALPYTRFDYSSKYIAHSVNEFEQNYVKLYYVQERPEDGVQSIGTGGDRLISLSLQDLDVIESICKKLLRTIKTKMNEEKVRLLQIVKSFTAEKIQSMGIETPKHPSQVDVTKTRK